MTQDNPHMYINEFRLFLFLNLGDKLTINLNTTKLRLRLQFTLHQVP